MISFCKVTSRPLLLRVLSVAVSVCAWLQPAIAEELREPEIPALQVSGLKPAGRLAVRNARDIAASNWSVGCETLDRGFGRYEAYRQFLGATGAKHIRLQAGWSRCERNRGTYDFSWLDAVVDDAKVQGVQPWLELGYGNPLYGGKAGLGSPIPSQPQESAAWDAWVEATVRHYQSRITTWAIWNEPDLRDANNEPISFARFHCRTAVIVRHIQPDAHLIALSLSKIHLPWLEALLDASEAAKGIPLFDEVSYHQYSENPDQRYGQVEELRALLARRAPHARVFQGESGAPSKSGGFGALAKLEWDEVRQAKWNLRRMLGDFSRGIRTNLFTLSDLRYEGNRPNDKGLLEARQDLSIIRPKQAWQAARHVFSLLDATWAPLAGSAPSAPGPSWSCFALRRQDGVNILAVWRSADPVNDSLTSEPLTLTWSGPAVPLLAVDVRSGQAWELPPIRPSGSSMLVDAVPGYDSPVLVGPREAFTLR